MFESEEIKKRKREEAYWKGVEKARQTGALEGFMDAMADLVVPDSMGTEEYKAYKQGYRDVASGKIKGKTSAPKTQEKPITLDVSEKAWYALCDNSDFMSDETVRHYSEALRAGSHHVAFVIGLSGFTGYRCPRCGEPGQFKIRFLGRIAHPVCGWSGYMGTGAYIGHQLAQIFHTGIRAGGSMKDDADRKGDRSGGWIYGIFTFLFVGVFRAALAVVLIPLHILVALFQPDQTKSELVTRVIILAIVLATFGTGIYEIQQASRSDLPVSQQVVVPQSPGSSSDSSRAYQPSVQPSFNCTKARTRVELLICRDSRLAGLDAEMVSTHNQVLSRLSPDARLEFRRQHLAWFKDYSRTCNQSPDDADRATCVANRLSAHTAELKNWSQ